MGFSVRLSIALRVYNMAYEAEDKEICVSKERLILCRCLTSHFIAYGKSLLHTYTLF